MFLILEYVSNRKLLSSSVDQTPAVSNDHDYTIHTPINDQLLAAQAKEKIMNLLRKLVTVEKRIFSLERFTYKTPQMIKFYTGFKD